VKVRVILDTNREASRNGPAFQALRAGGVKVVWADTIYEATHQKTITVDGTESLILSANLTDEYYSTTRDFGVFDHNPEDVAAIEAVFAADFAHEPLRPSNGSDLVWSPGSQAQMLAVIDGASHTLSIENEEMGDWTITNAIVAAAKRGVKVEVTMTKDSSYDSDWTAILSAGVTCISTATARRTCTSMRRRRSSMPVSAIKGSTSGASTSRAPRWTTTASSASSRRTRRSSRMSMRW